ncbi:MAG TPA: PDZ domain-containing protein [Anaeromyxobacteraceae bacterium]|nr:PDZ domain-containing protein [Anaeromyxobacteraceae bacterium]
MPTLASLVAAALATAPQPMEVDVDLRDAPRHVLHSRVTVPVRPGPLTLVYPKWIPGEHGPNGPVSDIAGLKITAGGHLLSWSRDPLDMFALRVVVPDGADRIEVALDHVGPPGGAPGYTEGTSESPRLAVLSWNQVLVYPQGAQPRNQLVAARLLLPAGWKAATALAIASASDGAIAYRPVSLETLVDSPVLAGAYLAEIPLGEVGGVPHWLVVAGDSEASLSVPADFRAGLERLVREAYALFGARHYGSYRFLLALSDNVSHFGLEHHESSDNRGHERALTDPDLRVSYAGLLPHEVVHSWNGKYRRPAGLATPDYQQPMDDRLLWIYEGLTTYLGSVLTVRSGLTDSAGFRETLALDAFRVSTPGRLWRPLEDTATASPLLFRSRPDGARRRRGGDYYPEGALVWLEADALIRTETRRQRSLDDFCRAFFGGADGPPEVRPYELADVLAALARVAPSVDWAAFFASRVTALRPEPPLAGIEAAGWRLGTTEDKPALVKAYEATFGAELLDPSLGVTLGGGDRPFSVVDVLPGSPADRAGLAPGSRLVAVNGRAVTRERVLDALRRGGKVELIVSDADFFRVLAVELAPGLRYPTLVRDGNRPDLLAAIAAPRAAMASPARP